MGLLWKTHWVIRERMLCVQCFQCYSLARGIWKREVAQGVQWPARGCGHRPLLNSRLCTPCCRLNWAVGCTALILQGVTQALAWSWNSNAPSCREWCWTPRSDTLSLSVLHISSPGAVEGAGPQQWQKAGSVVCGTHPHMMSMDPLGLPHCLTPLPHVTRTCAGICVCDLGTTHQVSLPLQSQEKAYGLMQKWKGHGWERGVQKRALRFHFQGS